MKMDDNFYLDDLIGSLERDVVTERYYPLIDHKEELTAILSKSGIVRRDQVSNASIEDIRMTLGDDLSRLFARFLHLYDFRESKLREIESFAGTGEYDELEGLLRLPGVRLLRAELYLKIGVTLETLVSKTTEEIRDMVRDYIRRGKRPETVPQPKEVNCHREVAKMILHTRDRHCPGFSPR